MSSFTRSQKLSDFQRLISEVYAVPDDRLYSVWDLLTQEQRFTMRALKGIRKGDAEKIKNNLLIAFAWHVAVSNRLHVNLEEEVWVRFPYKCSYCGKIPCECRATKATNRSEMHFDNSLRPGSLAGFQEMFREIYPPASRAIADAGVHLAEEMGEVSEALHNYLGEHKEKQFDEVRYELADYASCIFGLANSAGIDVAGELEAMFTDGCHVCHETPCVCSFTEVSELTS
jgi:NTP pyrophosphatase (non-canonical NTP hydrolase)